MPVDSFAKRMSTAGLPFPLGINVFPGTMSAFLGRATSAWNYGGNAPTPPPASTEREIALLGPVHPFTTRDPGFGRTWS